MSFSNKFVWYAHRQKCTRICKIDNVQFHHGKGLSTGGWWGLYSVLNKQTPVECWSWRTHIKYYSSFLHIVYYTRLLLKTNNVFCRQKLVCRPVFPYLRQSIYYIIYLFIESVCPSFFQWKLKNFTPITRSIICILCGISPPIWNR